MTPSPSCRSILDELIRDRQKEVRAIALATHPFYDGASERGAFLMQLSGESFTVREMLARELYRISITVVPVETSRGIECIGYITSGTRGLQCESLLIALAHDPSESVRAVAAECLVFLGTESAMGYALEVMSGDESIRTRLVVLSAIERTLQIDEQAGRRSAVASGAFHEDEGTLTAQGYQALPFSREPICLPEESAKRNALTALRALAERQDAVFMVQRTARVPFICLGFKRQQRVDMAERAMSVLKGLPPGSEYQEKIKSDL
jgi:hypothetical protein